MSILNLDQMPDDPAAQLLWLSGVREAVTAELDEAYAEAYANLRLAGQFEWALEQRLHAKKRALAMTRKWNRTRGGMLRWNDGIDPSSSAYRH